MAMIYYAIKMDVISGVLTIGSKAKKNHIRKKKHKIIIIRYSSVRSCASKVKQTWKMLLKFRGL
jgi:ribosomal protein L30E